MIPQSIQNFLTELDRLEYVAIKDIPFDVFAPVANGISDAESIESYVIKIDHQTLSGYYLQKHA